MRKPFKEKKHLFQFLNLLLVAIHPNLITNPIKQPHYSHLQAKQKKIKMIKKNS